MAQEQQSVQVPAMFVKYIKMINAEVSKHFPVNYLGEKVDKAILPDGSWTISYRGDPLAFVTPPEFDRTEWENGQVDISIKVQILPLT